MIPHGCHIYSKASDMVQSTMCEYPHSDHALPHCKCVLQCCADCQCIDLPDQETNNQYSETTPSIWFHSYHTIACCPAHVIFPFIDKKICCIWKQESSSDSSTKIYNRKELVVMETKISGFRTSFYIPAIQNLAFHLPHARILGANHRVEMRRTAFKQRELFQDVICRLDYTERVVAIYAHKIQSE